MTPPDIALALAGFIGAGVAVVHGVLVQKHLVSRFDNRRGGWDDEIPIMLRRLMLMLLHLSTVCWFVGGLMLVALAFGLAPGVRAPAAVFVGALFLYGVVGNFWATRGRHPGWMLMAVAVGLIAFGIG